MYYLGNLLLNKKSRPIRKILMRSHKADQHPVPLALNFLRFNKSIANRGRAAYERAVIRTRRQRQFMGKKREKKSNYIRGAILLLFALLLLENSSNIFAPTYFHFLKYYLYIYKYRGNIKTPMSDRCLSPRHYHFFGNFRKDSMLPLEPGTVSRSTTG